jgi:hypothetical protein
MSQNKKKKNVNSTTSTSINKVREKDYHYKNKQNKYEESAGIYLVPVFMILCILPFVIKLIKYNPKLSQNAWFGDVDTYWDFFLYYKLWLFVIIAVIMATAIIYKVVKNRNSIVFSPNYIPLVAYAFLVILSTIFSVKPIFSFGGSFEQFESVFALLGYCLAAYYAFQFIQAERDFKLIIKYLVIVAIIMGVLGVTQFIGHDFLGTKFMYNLMVSQKYQQLVGELTFNFGKGVVYLTLFNPNYVGVYAAMIVPIIFVMIFFQKKVSWIILSILAMLGLIISTIGAKSLAGVIGFVAAALCICVFMWRYLTKKIYITIPVIILLIIGLLLINVKTDNYFTDKFINMLKNSKTSYALTSMETTDTNVSLTYNGNKLYFQYVKNGDNTIYILITDENNNNVTSTYDQATNSFMITDERFNGLVYGFSANTNDAFYIQESGVQYSFTNQSGDGKYYYINGYGKLVDMVTAPSALFTGYENFASTRGYIWSRSIPLVKNHIFIGSGPDTFVLEYPQNDYLNMIRYGYANMFMTKPHSLYLQIAVQTGLLSLIAFLIFYGMYFVSSVRLYIRGRFTSYYSKVGVAIFIGTFAYMVTGLANDSSITTAPTFWVLIGLGIAANQKAKPLIKEENKEIQAQRLALKASKNG